MADLVVAGAGMAGLAAAAEARARGADVLLVEKRHRPGGAMLLSSGVVWRHRRFADFRAECPGGQPELQRLVFDRLDADLAWLEELGAPVRERGTGNERTTGVRFDTAGLTGALVRAAGGVRCGAPLRDLPAGVPVVLATGGFAASRALVREHITPEADALLLRSTPWSEGDGLRLALTAGAAPSAGLDEFYGRAMPALGGIRVDARGAAAPGVWAAGADVGGVATGSYASGLAAALVLGRVAAADALAGRAAAA